MKGAEVLTKYKQFLVLWAAFILLLTPAGMAGAELLPLGDWATWLLVGGLAAVVLAVSAVVAAVVHALLPARSTA